MARLKPCPFKAARVSAKDRITRELRRTDSIQGNYGEELRGKGE
jgi:hypothetical protein